MGELLPTREVARLVGVQPHVVEYLIRIGRLDPPLVVSGRRVWQPADVARLREAVRLYGTHPRRHVAKILEELAS